ncbi:hypothetical protein H6762_04940 [Candidatus Nomurabacteria bacterium]|nr:hypothetical protein [Candidatus Nomurabacteria bacterium]
MVLAYTLAHLARWYISDAIRFPPKILGDRFHGYDEITPAEETDMLNIRWQTVVGGLANMLGVSPDDIKNIVPNSKFTPKK